jgi:hypothetical protein
MELDLVIAPPPPQRIQLFEVLAGENSCFVSRLHPEESAILRVLLQQP